MTDAHTPPLGKIDARFFDRAIRPRLGRPHDGVLVGPKNGVDAAIVRVAPGRVMAVTTDPFFVVPAYGWKRAGWFAVHILASDLATTGLAPELLTVDLNLPPDTTDDNLAELWLAVHEACEALGVAVVTGHTGRYEGCAFPMIGGATMIGTGADDAWVAGGMSRPGDAVLVTKGAAIEAAALMAATFPGQVARAIGGDLAARADALFYEMSTVKDALVAASVGVRERGVTAMHDATEYGVLGGLVEMADAAGVGMRIDVDAIPVDESVRAICRRWDMDPMAAISEGTLLVTCRPHAAEAIVAALSAEGVVAARIGECTDDGVLTKVVSGRASPLVHPGVDPFWPAFARAAAEEAEASR